MSRLNVFGLIVVAVLLIPNVVFAAKCKDGFENRRKNKGVEIMEQIGRFGCFGFMIFRIPNTWFGFRSDTAFAVYLAVDIALTLPYCLVWIVCFRKSSVFRALALSILLLLMGSVEEEGDGAGADVRARDRLVADGQALPLQPRLF